MEIVKYTRKTGAEVAVIKPEDLIIDKTYFKVKSNSNGGGGQGDSNEGDSDGNGTNKKFEALYNAPSVPRASDQKSRESNYKQAQEYDAFKQALERIKEQQRADADVQAKLQEAKQSDYFDDSDEGEPGMTGQTNIREVDSERISIFKKLRW